MLKFSIKKERLNFMDGWSTRESDMGGLASPRLARANIKSHFELGSPQPESLTKVDNLLHDSSVYDLQS